jgi:hypothetical protein
MNRGAGPGAARRSWPLPDAVPEPLTSTSAGDFIEYMF